MTATDQTQCFLDAMHHGEIAAALAFRIRTTESFLDAFMALYEIRDLLQRED